MVKETNHTIRKISIVEGGILNTVPTRELTITGALDIIRSEVYRSILLPIRICIDKKKRDIMKSKLDYFLFGGTFEKRSKDGLKKSSGIVLMDLDDTTDTLKKKLMKDDYVNFMFVSPSGTGLKVGFKIPLVKNDIEYKQYWNAISEYLNIKENDEQTKDISRACYISYDKDLYYNPKSKVFEKKVELTEREDKESKGQTTKTKFEDVDKEFIEDNIFTGIKENIVAIINMTDKGKYPSRSERDMAVINHLMLKGFEKYIKSIFDLYPIGIKYKEETNPIHYLEHQIAAAREYTGVSDSDFSRLLEEIKNTPLNVIQNKLKFFLERISQIPTEIQRTTLKTEISYKTKIPLRELNNELNKIVPNKAVSLLEILNKPEVKRDFHVKGLLPKGQLILIGGRPENFKSQLNIALMMGMLSGTNVAGLEVDKVSPKILSYCLEMSETQFANGSKCFLSGLGITKYKKTFNNLKRQEIFSFDYERELEETKDADIIPIDSFRRVLRGSEDDSSNTAEFYNRFLKKLIQMGKTVILIAHCRKGSDGGIVKLLESDNNTLLDLIRGSGDIGAQLDTAFILHRTEEYLEDGKKKFVVVIRNCKNRDALKIKKATLIKVIADLDAEGVPIKTIIEPYDIGNVQLTQIEEAILLDRFIANHCVKGKDYEISNQKLWTAFDDFTITHSKIDVSKVAFEKVLDRMGIKKRKINYMDPKTNKRTSSHVRLGIQIKETKK